MTTARELLKEGRTAEALVAARAAYAQAPAETENKLLLGLCLALTQDASGARPLLTAALNEQGEAGDVRHWRLLGRVCAHMGDAVGEVAALREVLRREPNAETWMRLSAALIDAKRSDEALQAAATSLQLEDGVHARHIFVRALREAAVIDAPAIALVNRALAEGWARAEALQPSVIRLYRAGAEMLRLPMLMSGPLYDTALEAENTALRRRLLDGEAADLDLRAALAMQAFNVEYAWAVTDEELAKLDALAAQGTPEALLTFAAYRTLGELPGADDLADADVPEALSRVIRQQVLEPRRERELAAGIETITPIREGVSSTVREQYEQNPYPRWVHQPPEPNLPPSLAGTASSVLIAGCGTGQHVMSAAGRHPGAEILAVDLSRASLAYGMRKAEERGLTNVRFAQADLLELRDMTFDVIECAGVLHHLADPFEGMATLGRMLRPGGVMNVGVYSDRGCAFRAPALELAKAYPRTAKGIRALRQAILAAPQGDPLRAVTKVSDFYSLSMCRDLLMHAQEHLFTMADLKRLVSGYKVVRVALPDEVLARYRATYPGDPEAVDLDNWDVLEQQRSDTFGSMYRIWLQKPA